MRSRLHGGRGTFATASALGELSHPLRQFDLMLNPRLSPLSYPHPTFNLEFSENRRRFATGVIALAQMMSDGGSSLTDIADGRRYNPMVQQLQYRPQRDVADLALPSRSVFPAGQPMQVSSVSSAPGKAHLVGFADPKNTVICVRRKARREVILAKGRGGGAHKKPRRNGNSGIVC